MGVSLFCNMSWNLANRSNDSVGQEHYDAFALTLTAKTGLSLLMITQQRPKLPALDLEVVTSTNSLITLKDKMVDTDFAELKLVMRKADVLNFSLPLGSQNLDQTNSQLWLKET